MLEKLGKYRIDGVLGKGAMGVVYKAFAPHIERIVALKTIHKNLLRDHQERDLIARFKNEAQAAGRLSHPNIVALYEYGESDDTAYIAMEYFLSTPLGALLQNNRPNPPAVVISWVSQLLKALEYAHARGVVHRDIKPDNLLIDRDGQLKITDFGIARIESSTLTQAGAMVGAPCYMSPEQFRGEVADCRSDVFAVGVLLHQILAGVCPFLGSSSEIMQKITHETPPKPSDKGRTDFASSVQQLRKRLSVSNSRATASSANASYLINETTKYVEPKHKSSAGPTLDQAMQEPAEKN
jgi:serine/threonine protein kinase